MSGCELDVFALERDVRSIVSRTYELVSSPDRRAGPVCVQRGANRILPAFITCVGVCSL